MDRLEWIALAWHAQLGAAAFHRLLDCFGSPRAVCEAGEEELLSCRARLKPEDRERIWSAMDLAPDIAEEIERLEEDGVRVRCPFEEGYPPPLAALKTAPPVLCMDGDWDAAKDEPAVAIVGTRSPSDEGADFARDLARRFAQEGVTVVSGLARGIDTAAHEGALLGGGRTVAILGSGIRVIHPYENRELASVIARQGALMSELSPRARPSVRTLMARNRLQSALSRAVIVVECGEQGGSLQTAREAKRQARLLYAVEWPDDRPEAQGTRQLLAHGALPLFAPEEAPEVLRRIRTHTPGNQREGRKRSDGPRQLSLF